MTYRRPGPADLPALARTTLVSSGLKGSEGAINVATCRDIGEATYSLIGGLENEDVALPGPRPARGHLLRESNPAARLDVSNPNPVDPNEPHRPFLLSEETTELFAPMAPYEFPPLGDLMSRHATPCP